MKLSEDGDMKKRTWFMCVISLMMIGVMLMGSACSSKDKAAEQNIEESADTQAKQQPPRYPRRDRLPAAPAPFPPTIA